MPPSMAALASLVLVPLDPLGLAARPGPRALLGQQERLARHRPSLALRVPQEPRAPWAQPRLSLVRLVPRGSRVRKEILVPHRLLEQLGLLEQPGRLVLLDHPVQQVQHLLSLALPVPPGHPDPLGLLGLLGLPDRPGQVRASRPTPSPSSARRLSATARCPSSTGGRLAPSPESPWVLASRPPARLMATPWSRERPSSATSSSSLAEPHPPSSARRTCDRS